MLPRSPSVRNGCAWPGSVALNSSSVALAATWQQQQSKACLKQPNTASLPCLYTIYTATYRRARAPWRAQGALAFSQQYQSCVVTSSSPATAATPRVVNAQNGPIASKLVVRTSESNGPDPQQRQCPSAHDAWLTGHVKMRSAETHHVSHLLLL